MVMTDVQSVAANTTTSNILAGKAKEFCEEASIITVGVNASAVGLRCSLIIGSEVVIDDQEVSSINRMPQFPEDALAEGGAFAGDRITLRLRNTTAGAITGFTKINISPA